MTTAEGPFKLCSFVESQALPACPFRDEGNGFCSRHNEPRFTNCAGCPERHATHLCSCGSPLCGECIHHPPATSEPTDFGWHGPKTAAEGGSVDVVASNVTRVRDDLIDAVMLSRRRAEVDGLDEHDTAARIVNDLGTTVLLTLLSGMSSAPTQEGTPT